MSKKEQKSRVAVFVSKQRAFISKVAGQFKSVVNRETAYRTSIAELGTSLQRLRDLCETNHVSWQKIAVEHVGIPIRSANRYIALADEVSTMSANLVAKVSAAGFDAGSNRVQRRIKALGASKVGRMGFVELKEALTKKGTSRKTKLTPEQRFQSSLKAALKSYLGSLSNEMTDAKAIEQAQDYLNSLKVRASGLTLVTKAA